MLTATIGRAYVTQNLRSRLDRYNACIPVQASISTGLSLSLFLSLRLSPSRYSLSLAASTPSCAYLEYYTTLEGVYWHRSLSRHGVPKSQHKPLSGAPSPSIGRRNGQTKAGPARHLFGGYLFLRYRVVHRRSKTSGAPLYTSSALPSQST